MQKHTLILHISELKLAICQLPPEAPVPGWVGNDPFFSISRTRDELSIVCCEERVPADVKAVYNWRMIKVKGPLDFSLTGILASLVSPLSDAGIAIFALSTYDTDYLLLKEGNLKKAVSILEHTCIIENFPEN